MILRMSGVAFDALSSPQPCAERARLFDAYLEAAEIYHHAGRRLMVHAGVTGQAEHIRIRDRCERARIIAEDAFRIAERHIAEHGC